MTFRPRLVHDVAPAQESRQAPAVELPTFIVKAQLDAEDARRKLISARRRRTFLGALLATVVVGLAFVGISALIM